MENKLGAIFDKTFYYLSYELNVAQELLEVFVCIEISMEGNGAHAKVLYKENAQMRLHWEALEPRNELLFDRRTIKHAHRSQYELRLVRHHAYEHYELSGNFMPQKETDVYLQF